MITTKKGDGGKSSFGGRLVEKDGQLLETIGTIDELVALLGIAKMKNKLETVRKIEKKIIELRQIMGMISGYELKNFDLDESIRQMDKEVEEMEAEIGVIGEFLDPGRGLDEFLNWCRTVARRCERRVVGLSKTEKIDDKILIYFNRLSDYLFMLARKTKG